MNKKFARSLRVDIGAQVSLSDVLAETTGGWAKPDAERRTKENLAALEELQYQLYADGGRALLVVLQGIDAAGKDGVVRKVFTAFNPQGTSVTSFKVPVGSEVSHDFLWRVHGACPPRGTIGIFNRSHYEDLIVPMIRGTLKPKQLRNREEQIRAFENMLVNEETTIVKFLLHISRDEQWERLMSRLDEPTRNWKFSMGDLAERQRWDLYISTFQHIVAATSTDVAPWYVIPANSKWFRDLAVSEVVRSTLEGMKLQWPKASLDAKLARRELKKLR